MDCLKQSSSVYWATKSRDSRKDSIGMNKEIKTEKDRLFEYALRDLPLNQVMGIEGLKARSSFKEKLDKLLGISYTPFREGVSTLSLLQEIVKNDFQISGALLMYHLEMNITESKSLSVRFRSVFHTTFKTIIGNLKQEVGKKMRENLKNLTKSQKIILSQVLGILQDSSKRSPLTLNTISNRIGSSRERVRQVIVWLRKLGVPVVSRPGRYNSGYYFADPGYENKEEQICLSWVNTWRDSRWRKPALSVLFGM